MKELKNLGRVAVLALILSFVVTGIQPKVKHQNEKTLIAESKVLSKPATARIVGGFVYSILESKMNL